MGDTVVGLHQLYLPKEDYYQIMSVHIGLGYRQAASKCNQTQKYGK